MPAPWSSARVQAKIVSDGSHSATPKTKRNAVRDLPSVDERAAAGKAARSAVPRSSHADWQPAKDRPDPVAVLEQQATTRVSELIPLRHGRMLATPFTFFRGAAAIMAADLAGSPESGLAVQACGDAHLSNFGGFGSPDRQLVFDVNDFDETLPGRGSGTSSASRRASPWADVTEASALPTAGGSSRRRWRNIARRCGDCRGGRARCLVHATRCRGDRSSAGLRTSSQDRQGLRAQRGQGAREGQHARVQEADA